jgi:hypothetical protein
LSKKSAEALVSELLLLCGGEGAPKTYVLIDEYDHFANEVMAFDFNRYQGMVSQNGYVRKFYEALKTAAGDGVMERFFATGVTPITLDSLTSGFNISADLTRDVDFNAAMGFTEGTARAALEGLGLPEPENALSDMRRWYNGYRFAEEAAGKIYNPDMCLYFLKSLERHGAYPKTLVDHNVASDYGKMGRLFHIMNPEQNFGVLEEIVAGNKIHDQLTERFSFERPFTKRDFVSMLFYMGFLTIKGADLGMPLLGVPNYVIKRLYIDFAAERLEAWAEGVSIRSWDAPGAMVAMARHNDLSPFLGKVQETLKRLSVRDGLNFDEKHLKTIMVALLNMTEVYFIKSESEFHKGYADIFLAKRPPVEPTWQFAFELKYVKKGAGEGAAKKALEEAKAQLAHYWQSEEWQAETNLRAYAVVFLYDELYAAEEVAGAMP